MMTVQLNVPDMACGACAETITKAILQLDPSASVKTDPETKQVTVETQVEPSAIALAIAEAGYSPSEH